MGVIAYGNLRAANHLDSFRRRYSCTLFGRGPNLHYQHHLTTKNFSGSQVRVVEVPDVGTLVSVTLELTVDSGSTSFTLLLPRVNLPPPPALPAFVPVITEGITTHHHLSLVQGFDRGQQNFYNVTKLHGTAA